MLERYLAAWERGDVEAFAALLHADVVLSMPPIPAWIRGHAAAVAFLRPRMVPGAQRLVPVAGADEVALAYYRRDAHGVFTARAIEIVAWDDSGQVREIHAFFDLALVDRWGVPPIAR